ncbi:MAG TPA: FAD-dependent monooxygenase [Streptosporangiaceae bacterium]|nr:FAD-dependent monooxygenase [Streptosporangiaceae bacterium]
MASGRGFVTGGPTGSGPSILVAGAGPAGLALALQAHDHGADVRVIERRSELCRPSRALILHSRTLEMLRPLGVTDALLARADVAPSAELRLGRRKVRVRLADLALPDTAFPHLTLIRQADVEAVLARALDDRGIGVERGTELVGLHDEREGASAVLRSGGVRTEVIADVLCGCDGPDSTVRSEAGIGWPGCPYPVEIVLADAELAGDLPDEGAQVVAGRDGLVFAFRLGERAPWRLLVTRPASPDPVPFGQPGQAVPAAELQSLLNQARSGIEIESLAWSARVRVQHRVARRFRRGRLYLVGDAAHAYSPATGQGLNAAIQDALNLGWKLAFGASRPDSGALLGSYEIERRPVARQVLAMTHLAFWGEAGTGRVPALLRGRLAPLAAPAVPALMRRHRLVGEGVRLISQLRVNYRRSPISAEDPLTRRHGRGARAGDRLSDEVVTCAGRNLPLHELIARPGVHVLLDRDAGALEDLALGPLVHLHRITSKPGCGLVAVRPDGYIGMRCQVAGREPLAAWLDLIRAPWPGNQPKLGLAGLRASE